MSGTLPRETGDLLLVAALHPTADISLLLSAASRLRGRASWTSPPWNPAGRQGLVTFDGMRMRFSHPALAGAVVHGTGPSCRCAAHAALADTLKQGSARQLWHLSQAVEGPGRGSRAALWRTCTGSRCGRTNRPSRCGCCGGRPFCTAGRRTGGVACCGARSSLRTPTGGVPPGSSRAAP